MIRTVPLPQVQPRRTAALVEALGALVLLLVALPTRLTNLDAFVGKFDEGIRGEQLLLMAAGYRPFRDIFASQGPLSLDVFFPTFMLFGQNLGAARLAPALLSIIGIVATACAARLVAGPVAGLTAMLILVVSPTFLKNARLALVEVPALAPATAAVAAALAYQRFGNWRWAALAGVLLSLSLLIKPMVLPVLIPVALAIWLRGPGWVKAGLACAAAGVALAAVAIALLGPVEIYDQMVRFRLASRQIEGWSLKENWSAMAGELIDEQLALYGMAALAAAVLLWKQPRMGFPVVAWPLASFVLLMLYSPLQFKHAVIMLPPLALLVGAGVGVWWSLVAGAETRSPRSRRAGFVSYATLGIGVVAIVWYGLTLPSILGLDSRIVSALPENRPETYDEEVALIQTFTTPRDVIVSDEPSVAFGSRRLVPPSLVDTSMVRIRARALDAGAAIAATEASDAKLLFLYSDGLRSIRRFAEWVDERYVPVQINERRNGKDRAIYLRDDEELEAARQTLERSLEQPDGRTFGGQLQLLGFRLERGEVRPGGALTLTLGWRAVGPVSADYHVLTILRDGAGSVVEQNERSLGGGADGTASWREGRWVFRTATLPIRASSAPGAYGLSVALYDSKARRNLPPDTSTESVAPDELPLTVVQVRG